MDGDKLADLYKIRFLESELPRKNAIWQVICEQFLQKFVTPSDTVVDIACGYGEFINNIKAARKLGFDLNPESASHLVQGVEFHCRKATDLSLLVQSQADVVFASNFLEHLPDKPTLEMLLDQVLLALKPSGKFLILGPNLRYLPGEYWDFYDHHLGLTHLSLCEVLKLKGFDIVQCIDRFLPYTTQGALPTHPMLVKAYLNVRLAWPLLGKQFFVVAQKPSIPPT